MVYNILDRLEELKKYLRYKGFIKYVERRELTTAITSVTQRIKAEAIQNSIIALSDRKYIKQIDSSIYFIYVKLKNYQKPTKRK